MSPEGFTYCEICGAPIALGEDCNHDTRPREVEDLDRDIAEGNALADEEGSEWVGQSVTLLAADDERVAAVFAASDLWPDMTLDQRVGHLADIALDNTLGIIGDHLEEISGDWMPGEIADLEGVFRLLVRAACSNYTPGRRGIPTPDRVNFADLEVAADALLLLADLDEGENTDTDQLRATAAKFYAVCRPGYPE